MVRKYWLLFKDAVSGKEMDYTEGSIRKAIFMLSIPMILEMSMESIFALVDIFYVSKVSTNAVATIGLTESVLTLVYALSIGLSMGVTALVARRTGEKDHKGAIAVAVQAILIGLVISVFISLFGILFPKEILSAMGGEEGLINEGYRYTQIMLGGNLTIMLLFLINAIFRGAGDASIAMRSLVISNCINLILDPILIFGIGPFPELGLEGAAIATNIGRGTGVLFQLYILFFGHRSIKVLIHDISINIGLMVNIIKVSLGGIGQFIIATSSWMFLMRIMALFGSDVLAGYTIAIRVLIFTLMPSWGMSNAVATLVGQNLGAKKIDRAEKSVWITGKYNAVFMVMVSMFYLLFAPSIISWFTKDINVVTNGAMALRIVASGYFFYAYGMVITQAFNGAGDTRTPTLINFICFWLFQLPFAYFSSIYLKMEQTGVFLAIVLAESLIAVLAMIWFKKGKWKTIEI